MHQRTAKGLAETVDAGRRPRASNKNNDSMRVDLFRKLQSPQVDPW